MKVVFLKKGRSVKNLGSFQCCCELSFDGSHVKLANCRARMLLLEIQTGLNTLGTQCMSHFLFVLLVSRFAS